MTFNTQFHNISYQHKNENAIENEIFWLLWSTSVWCEGKQEKFYKRGVENDFEGVQCDLLVAFDAYSYNWQF